MYSRKLRMTIAAMAVGMLGLFAATSASADVTNLYHPDPEARNFATSPGGWTGSSEAEGLCVPVLLCPVVSNDFESSGGAGGAGDGYLRTEAASIASVGGTVRGIWQSPAFIYNGVGGAQPDEVTFSMARRSDVDQLLAVLGDASYKVELVGIGGALTVIDTTQMNDTPTFSTTPTVDVDPNQLTVGSPYLIRITSEFEVPVSVFPNTSADYDNVVLAATDVVAPGDGDGDGVPDGQDNCPSVSNPGQVDTDGDGIGDACEAPGDDDGDGTPDATDNCPTTPNPGQADADLDGIGDACEVPGDDDGDGVPDGPDNCNEVANPDQTDTDGDGIGDACEVPGDDDGDGTPDGTDNCPTTPNPGQADADGDGIGDACEVPGDDDGDGVPDGPDNCDQVANPGQADADGDGIGDACDGVVNPPDSDGDGVPNATDNCPAVPNAGQADTDGDGIGNACDPVDNNAANDIDGDGIPNANDNCPAVPNAGQADTDLDGIGDVCDPITGPNNNPNPNPNPTNTVAASNAASLVTRDTAVIIGNRVLVQASCPRKAKKPCKVRLVGLLNGAVATATGKKKLKPGNQRVLTLTIRPELQLQVQALTSMQFRQTTRIGKKAKTKIRTLKILRAV